MKKLLYILLCILFAMNLISCNGKVVSNITTDRANDISVNKIEGNNSSDNDISNKNTKVVINNDVNENSSETDNKKVTNITPPTSQTSKSSESISKSNTENNKVSENITNSTAQQISQGKNKVIVIDPGHANRSNLEKEPLAPGSTIMKIKDGGGAQGVVTGTPEYRISMNVSQKLKAILQSSGYTVVMTKTQDSQSLGNVERVNIWNNAHAALVIRIHADSSTSSSAKGASMLVPSPINNDTKAIYAASKGYGKTVLNALVQEVGMPNRGVIEHSDMTGFNWTKVPVILVEMGFLSNPDEDKLLSNQAYEDKLAKALADGIKTAIK